MAATPVSSSLAARQQLRSIQDIAARISSIHSAGRDGAAFRRIYQVSSGDAACSLSPELAAKYSLEQSNRQRVICITNRY